MKANNLNFLEDSFSGNSHIPGSQFSQEVNFPGKSIYTKDIHDVQISAIYDTQPKLMRQVMKYADARRTDDGRHRVICSRRPDSFAAGKNDEVRGRTHARKRRVICSRRPDSFAAGKKLSNTMIGVNCQHVLSLYHQENPFALKPFGVFNG